MFLKFRSGTHNNQWLVIDLGLYKRTGRTEILMVEEGFDISAVTNFTDRFYKDGFVASYNVPFDQKIYDKLNYTACNWNRKVDGFDYENDPRAILFRRYNDQIIDYPSLKRILRTNEEDDKADGIAPRFDLSKKSKFEFGMIDQKICWQ